MNPSAIPQNQQLAKPGQSSLYDPLVLYADTTLPTGAAVSPNTAALRNPHSLPMELLGIRFHIHTLNTANETGPLYGAVSGLGVGVKLDMGKIPLVDAGTPVSLFSNARDDSEDGLLGYLTYSTPGAYAATVAGAAIATASPAAYSYDYFWRLRDPLFVPPGAVVTPLFSHLTQTPWDVRVGVSYYCRTFRQSRRTPTHVSVPWVSKYVSKSFDITQGANAADSDTSSELDIYNPFPGAAVELSRLTGRVNFYAAGSNSGMPNSNFEYSTLSSNMGDQIYEYLRVKIRSSRGDEIVRVPTLFGSLFPQVIKTWDFPLGWTMQPNEFYKVFLTRSAFTGPGQAAGTGRMQVAMAAIGHRKINTSTLEGAL